jgi:hypothetical protein
MGPYLREQETVETVEVHAGARRTSLKRGVNEIFAEGLAL